MRRILITGATGFTGRHACRLFAATGWEVIGVSSGRSGGTGEPRGAAPQKTGGSGEALRKSNAGGEALRESGVCGEDQWKSRVCEEDQWKAGVSREDQWKSGVSEGTGEPRGEWREYVPPIVGCDLTEKQAVFELCRELQPDAVLHLAGQNAVDRSWQRPDETLAVNVLSTVHLLEGMRASGRGERGRILVVGSMLTNASLETAAHPYGFSKAVQVAAALNWHNWYGIEALAVEPSNLIGPGGSLGLCGKLARWVAAEEAARLGRDGQENPEGEREASRPSPMGDPIGSNPFVLSSLAEERDYLDVRDAVSAYEALLLRGQAGRLYSLGSGVMRTLGEVKEAFDVAAKVKLAWQIRDQGGPSPQPRDLSDILSLGWRPLIPFTQSIEDALEDERYRLGESNRKG